MFTEKTKIPRGPPLQRGRVGGFSLPQITYSLHQTGSLVVAAHGWFGVAGAFDADIGQPFQPLGEVLVLVTQQFHARRYEHHADDGGVQNHRNREAEAHLLEHGERSQGESAENGHHDLGSAGDDGGCRF